MSISQELVQHYGDIVFLKNRTENTVEFMWDSRVYVLKPRERKPIARFLAEHAVNKLAAKYDASSGLVLDSLVAIEGDVLDDSPLGAVDLEALKEEEKNDFEDTAVVERDQAGNLRKTKRVPLKLKADRPAFVENNQPVFGETHTSNE